MADKKKRPVGPRMKSPKSVFVFPKLNAADTKFKAEGEFAVKARMVKDRPDVQAFIAKLEPLHQAAMKAGQEAFDALPVASRKKLKAMTENDLYTEVFDEDENPTGEIEFKFSLPASGKIKDGKNKGRTWIKRPTIADAKGKVLVAGTDFAWLDESGGSLEKTVLKRMGPAIWGGSEGICAIEVALGRDDEPGYFIPGTGAAGLSLRLRAVQVTKLVQGSSGEQDYGFEAEEGFEGDEDADTSDESDEGAVPPNDDEDGSGGDF
jgi:hypothetical protein